MSYSWASFYVPGGPAIIAPLHDAIEHEHTDCPCGPTAELGTCADGSDLWFEVHHPLDGRE